MSSKSEESKLPVFLQNFSSKPHYRKPAIPHREWVFWSESEGSENISTSADLLGTPIFDDKFISNLRLYRRCLGQFWAPITIRGRRLLSTSAQPFVVRRLSNKLAKYRVNSEKDKFNIDDENKVDIEPDQMIKSGGPATAFLNCRTSITKLQGFLSDSDDDEESNFTIMFPICFPSQSSCIGVLEFTFFHPECALGIFINRTVKTIKDVGLDVFYVQHLIPYTTLNGLEVTKDEIEKALKVVCESHNLALAQVWIVYEDKNNVPFSYSLEDSQTKQLFAIKLTGYLYASSIDPDRNFDAYFRLCDVVPHSIGKQRAMVTLQDYESRYISTLRDDILIEWNDHHTEENSAFAICLRSNVTGVFNYMFEFIWSRHPNYSNYVIFLEDILLKLQSCLPGFKFASGAELGDELEVILVDSSTDDEIGETQKFKIFQEKRSTLTLKAPEKGKNPMVVQFMAPSNVTGKTTPKVLPREVIVAQFGKTLQEAAKILNVHPSTLKRKLKQLGIPRWHGPKSVKRNAIGSSIIQSNTNEEDNEAIQDPSTIHTDKDMLTFKANYGAEMIKFHIPIVEATLTAVENKLVKQLNLTIGNFKLKYLDEDGAWISIVSKESMSEHIDRLRILHQDVVQLSVEPSTQPTSPPSVSNTTATSSTWNGLSSL